MGTKGYLIGQGYNNLTKHGGKTFSTIIILCATMFILGIFIIAFVNIQTNIKIITENQGLQAFISDDVDDYDIGKIKDQISQIANVKSIDYLDKDAAFEDAKETLKDYSYLLDGLESINPFPRSFIVVFENLESVEKVKEAVESVDGIYNVEYNEAIINAVISIAKVGNIILIAFGALMICVSIFIISNTIKLSVYSNKREIYIMKYIGATPSFIKTPFVVSGVFMGLAAAGITWVVVSIAYIALFKAYPINAFGEFGLVSYRSIWYIVLAAFVLVGIMLGGIGSSIAIKKYLKDFRPSKELIKIEKAKIKKEKKAKSNEKEKEKIIKKNEEKRLRKEAEERNYQQNKQDLQQNKSRKEGRRNAKK